MKAIPKSSAATHGAQTVQRSCMLLRLIARNNRTGLRLVDIYRACELERPTAHRLLQALVSEGFLKQGPGSKLYFLGSALYAIGLSATPQQSLRDICHPFLRRIAAETGDTVFLAQRENLDSVCLDRAEGAFPVKAYVVEIGHRRPLTVGGSSLAILSTLPDDEIDRICQSNYARTIQAHPRYLESALRERIQDSKRDGYLLSPVLDIPDILTIAVPLVTNNRFPTAAISVSTVSSRLDKTRAAQVALLLRATVDKIVELINQDQDQDENPVDMAGISGLLDHAP